jgi:hypothetical protein
MEGEQRDHILIEVAPFILEHEEDIFAVRPKIINEGRESVVGIGQQELESPRVECQDTFEKAQGRLQFAFSWPLGFHVQQQAQFLSQQHQGHVPVVVLPPIPRLAMDRPFQAAGTVTPVAGMTLMAIENRHR